MVGAIVIAKPIPPPVVKANSSKRIGDDYEPSKMEIDNIRGIKEEMPMEVNTEAFKTENYAEEAKNMTIMVGNYELLTPTSNDTFAVAPEMPEKKEQQTGSNTYYNAPPTNNRPYQEIMRDETIYADTKEYEDGLAEHLGGELARTRE